MSLESNIDELQPWLQTYIDRLDPAGRKKLLRQMGMTLRRENSKRITAQKSPEGQAWKARYHSPLRHKITGAKLVFKYSSGKTTRNVAMKSYRDDGDTIIGYDLFSDDIRRFSKSKITQMSQRRTASSGLRHKKMFVGARKQLRTKVLANQIRVGWQGRTARILHHHHYGNARTAQRELIGINDTDKQLLSEVILNYVEHG